MPHTHFTLRAAALTALAGLVGLGHAADANAWKTRSIYQVMVDRFARTDGSTTATCTLSDFCNGTWAGLINKLDYIQGMGFTAVQISPTPKNIDDLSTPVGTAYHGYWPTDLYQPNPRFGTASDLKKLSDALHARGMYLMVDVVVNDMAQGFGNTYPPPIDYSKFNPFNDQKYFHDYCNVTDWSNVTNYQQCWLYPYGVALADLKTESDDVAKMLGTWIGQLVSNFSIDGLRIDAAKHVNDAFLPAFVAASGVFALGEVYTGATNDMCRYQTLGLLPGMPNYVEYFAMINSFNGGSMANLSQARTNAQQGCNDSLALGTFVENHDLPRFAALASDLALAKNAMTFNILNDGIPTVYQGQEQHFRGNGTPFNREPLWQSNYDTGSTLYLLTTTLNKLRNHAIALSASYATSYSTQLLVDVNHLCLAKGPKGSQIVHCITNESSKGSSYQMAVSGGFSAGDAVTEVLTCSTQTADGSGNIQVAFAQGEPRVFVLSSFLSGTGLCPTTTVQPAAPKNAAEGRKAPNVLVAVGVVTVVSGLVQLLL